MSALHIDIVVCIAIYMDSIVIESISPPEDQALIFR